MLLRSSSGKWNFSSLGANRRRSHPSLPADPGKSSTPELSVNRLNVNNGRWVIAQTHGQQKPQVYDKVGIEVRNFL